MSPQQANISLHEKKETQNTTSSSQNSSNVPTLQSLHLHGWRLCSVTFAIMLGTFLVNIEVSIVSTSLITIANSLGSFNKTSWIVTGYLVTYTGFMIIWSKLSDIVGRKMTFVTTMIFFVLFSAGVGASQTMNQLIILRVFQGIGAAGTYSLAVVILFEMVPPTKYAMYSGGSVAVVSIANIIGPIFGGLISDAKSWRWAFFFIVPFGVLAIGLMLIAFPARRHDAEEASDSDILKWETFGRLDILGAAILIVATMLLVTALLEASLRLGWRAGLTIALVVLSGISWIGFFTWERFATIRKRPEPIFPWTFFSNVTWVGLLITSFLVGVPFNTLMINIPQRLQALNDLTPLEAGLRLLPYTVVSPVCSIISNFLASRARIPLIILLLAGALSHLVGIVLLSTQESVNFQRSTLAYEALAGAGVGITFSLVILGTPFVVTPRDIAVATGAVVQLRFLGGAVGVAITSSYMNSYLNSSLRTILDPDKLLAVMQDIRIIQSLPYELKLNVKQVLVHGYAMQNRILIGFTVAQVLALVLMWRKKPLRIL